MSAAHMTTREWAALFAAITVVATGCSKRNSAGDTTSAMAPDTTTAAPAVAVTTEVAPGVVLTTVAEPGTGIFLADANGRAVYILDSAPRDTNAWKPVNGKSMPTSADTSVKSSMLGTRTGANGSQQATYNGKPLYYYNDDTPANRTSGQGANASGATGHLVSPSGSAISRSAKK